MQQTSIELLVIDDTPEDREMVEHLLAAAARPYLIRTARTAAEGISEFKRHRPDCILLDLNLPDRSGLDCLGVFQTSFPGLPCAVILLTGSTDRRLTKQALGRGAQDYLLKSELATHTLERAIDHALLRCRLIWEREQASLALAQSERLLRLAQEAAGIGTFSWNLQTNETEFGGAYFSLYGLSPQRQQMSFSDWLTLIHPDDRDRIRMETEESIASGGQFNYEYRVVWPDGSVHWQLGRGAVVTDDLGRPLTLTGVNLDVTASKSLEHALVTANDELRHFAWAAGHDLQAPLRNVIAFTELLECTLGSQVNGRALQALTFVRSSSEQMRLLVSDLLAYAQSSDPKEMHAESVPLHQSLQTALENISMDIVGSEALVTWDEHLPAVCATGEQMTQVFQNLIGNAIKHRQVDVPPRVHISAMNDGSKWVISVRDNGAGFDMKYASLIFRPFQRLTNSRIPGSGLGLSICKRVVERWGGEIWAISEPGKGSTFSFSLPAAASARAS